jgi:hypothetical protein
MLSSEGSEGTGEEDIQEAEPKAGAQTSCAPSAFLREGGTGTHTLSPWRNSSGRSFNKFFLIQTRRFRISPREEGTEQTNVKPT